MLCPKCGAEVGDKLGLCTECAVTTGAVEPTGMEEDTDEIFDPEPMNAVEVEQAQRQESVPDVVKPAGFWLRFVAWLVDSTVVFIPCQLLGIFVFSKLFSEQMERFLSLSTTELWSQHQAGLVETSYIISSFLSAVLPLLALGLGVTIIIGWLYFALMEASPYQATLGKLAVGLFVTDLKGERISFARATGRHFSKILSDFTFTIGYVVAGVTEKKQALHDILSGCLVSRKPKLKAPRLVATIIFGLIFWFGARALLEESRWLEPKPVDIEYEGTEFMPEPDLPPVPLDEPSTLLKELPVVPSSEEPAEEPAPTTSVEMDPFEFIEGSIGGVFAEESSASFTSVVALHFPKYDRLEIGFFVKGVTEGEIELMKQKGTVSSYIKNRRPNLVLNLLYREDTKENSVDSLVHYNVTLLRDFLGGFYFPGRYDRKTLERGSTHIEAGELSSFSGTLQKGGRIQGVVRGTEKKYGWSVEFDTVVHQAR